MTKDRRVGEDALSVPGSNSIERGTAPSGERSGVSQGQMVAVSVQPPSSVEAQILQQLPPEHLHKALEASTQIQLRNLELQAKELDQTDADRERAHQRSMREMELRAKDDRGLLVVAVLLILGVAVFVGSVVVAQRFEMAEKIVYALAGALGGYVAGRANRKRSSE